MAYSAEEIKAFADKDLRITKIAICKSLIEKLSMEEINDTEKVFELADKYVDYIYGVSALDSRTHVDKGIESGTEPEERVVYKLDLASIPNEAETKILDAIFAEYKSQCPKGKTLNYTKLCNSTIKAFGKYPTSKSSVSKVMSVVKLETILN